MFLSRLISLVIKGQTTDSMLHLRDLPHPLVGDHLGAEHHRAAAVQHRHVLPAGPVCSDQASTSIVSQPCSPLYLSGRDNILTQHTHSEQTNDKSNRSEADQRAMRNMYRIAFFWTLMLMADASFLCCARGGPPPAPAWPPRPAWGRR